MNLNQSRIRILVIENPTKCEDSSSSAGFTHTPRARILTGAAYSLFSSMSALPPFSKPQVVFALSPRRLRSSTTALSSSMSPHLIRAEKNGGQ